MSKKISFVAMQKIVCLKFWIIFMFVVFCCTSSKAQLNHYIYLQTENQQPFYIKYNNKVYSSSVSGYLILARLKDGAVGFLMGFPKTDESEQKFEYTIDRVDKGFLIKKFAGKGWGLYDLQNSAITYAVANQANAPDGQVGDRVNQQTANDPFANMLSKVTQDSTVKNVVVKKEEKITVTVDTPKQVVQQIVKIDTPKQSVQQPAKTDTPKIETKPDPVVVTPPVQTEPAWIPPSKSLINKLKSYETKEGSDLIFEVKNESGTTDTIRLFIPATQPKQIKEEPVITKPEVKKDTIPQIIVEEKKETPPQQPVVVEQQPVAKETIPVVEKKPDVKSIPNSNCSAEAKEEDFIKLRRRMAAQTRDEGMVNEAKKVFKTKCFSSSQLKNLSVLFLTDEWRYRFYDAALPYVTDFSNFKNLSETIQDEYYKKRFFALLPNQ
jgi:hypothetical protein